MTTLTSRYTMVVPREAREDLRLKPGMRVDLRKNHSGQWVLVRTNDQAKRWVGKYPCSMNVSQEMAELRGRTEDDFS